MAQFEISDSLYQQLYERAQQSGQTLEAFLASFVANQPLAHPEFVALLTHDMRTPLATIMTSLQVLTDGYAEAGSAVVTVAVAATRLHQTGHSSIVKHFQKSKVRRADFAVIRF